MKGKIFIAWSGKNDLAVAVKNKLEQEDYLGIVGGQSRTDGGLFVGEVVLRELDQCNQAIFIVQKKANGLISNNLMFELGYALSRFETNRIHVFYIDITPDDKTIPSDIKGIWANFYQSDEADDISAKLIEDFLANQKNIIPDEKMSVIDSFYGIREKIRRYPYSPHCSEYEFAQYILFFAQAAYMFDSVEYALGELKDLIRKLNNVEAELDYAIRSGICYLEMLAFIQKDNGVIFLKKEDFRNINRRLKSLIEKGETWEENDFTLWFLAMLYDQINFIRLLYAFCPELTEEEKQKSLLLSMEYGKKCLEVCEKLEKQKNNYLMVQLYKAYVYRNFYTVEKNASKDSIKASEYLNESLKSRKYLIEYYETHTINSVLFDNFEMEYFLALSEYFEYVDDEDDLLDYKEDCQDYISRKKNLYRDKNHYISVIEELVRSVTI